MTFRTGFTILCLSALLLAGCARKLPDPVRVEGSVTCDGKPANGVLVTFWPEETRRRSASAICDSGGKFSLECVSGAYKVTVSPNLQGSGAPGVEGGGAPRALPQQSLAIPPKYSGTSITPLHVEVPEGGASNVVLTLKR